MSRLVKISINGARPDETFRNKVNTSHLGLRPLQSKDGFDGWVRPSNFNGKRKGQLK